MRRPLQLQQSLWGGLIILRVLNLEEATEILSLDTLLIPTDVIFQ